MTDNSVTPDPRAEYIAGLRQLADALEQHPELNLPFNGRTPESNIFVTTAGGGDPRGQVAAWARVLPGRKDKRERGEYLDLHGAFRGLHIKVIANREAVCEKVVIGTETVTEIVPDPVYIASAPMIERETEREIVEWVCPPSILADAEPVGAAA